MRVLIFGTFFNLCILLASGSIIELNATKHASLPQLYDLDDWTRCRNPGDVYCTVDAVLFSRNSSTLLQLLQDYSEQTLKHYNRTQIHRGLCVTQCGRNDNSKSFRSAAQRCLNQRMQEYGLEVEVLSLNGCKLVDEPTTSASSSALGVLCISLVVLTFLASVLHIFSDKCAAVEGNKYLLAFSLKRNWSILTYDRSMPRADDRMKNVACMEGIRFLGTQCVIFSHVIFIYVYSYVDNPDFVERMYDQFVWQGVFNSPVWLQAFFGLSGFLTAYTILICAENKPYTLLQCLLGIINRYIRLTPVALFALWFTMSWFPLLGNGPQWWWLVEREAQECVERWGYHALYIHNHLPLGKLCMGHTWYLAVDMQLHVLGMILLLLMVRYRQAVAPVVSLLIVGSSLAAGLVVYLNDLTPIITAQSPEALRTMFKSSLILPLLYLPTWMNLAGYASGIATAFILHHNQLHGVKLNEKRWFNLVYHLSLTLGGCVVLAGTVFLWDETPPRWASALYAALDRTLVSIAFGCFMLGCFSGCKSLIRNALEWRGFHALGRLSYCAYIIHFIVLRMTLASNTQLGHVTILSMISLLITASVLTYVVSIPVCLLVELPFIQLWKALTQRDKRPERPETPPQPRIKPFDLLAHVGIGKRNEA